MALGQIKTGFTGIASSGGNNIRCTDFNIVPKQEAEFYDHTIGLRDSIPSSIYDQKGDDASLNSQKRIWRPGVISYQGSIGHPLTSSNSDYFFNLAKNGADFDLDFYYSCNDITRNFSGCKINSYNFNATAGDVINVGADIMALSCEDASYSENIYDEEEKIITWDDLIFEMSEEIVELNVLQSLSFSINNNCKYIYTAKNNFDQKLNPYKIRVGMQHVTGTLVYYNKGRDLSFMHLETSPKTLSISCDGLSITMNVIFKPQERSSSTSFIISSLPFVGVDFALGE